MVQRRGYRRRFRDDVGAHLELRLRGLGGCGPGAKAAMQTAQDAREFGEAGVRV